MNRSPKAPNLKPKKPARRRSPDDLRRLHRRQPGEDRAGRHSGGGGYPELVRLSVMAGAQIMFHPNAGMDDLAVSRAKRRGRDGIPVRAFENAVFYVFANSAGPQGGGRWSAGDSKIVAPDGSFLRLADHRREQVLVEDLYLSRATRKYALDSLKHPRFQSPSMRIRVIRG